MHGDADMNLMSNIPVHKPGPNNIKFNVNSGFNKSASSKIDNTMNGSNIKGTASLAPITRQSNGIIHKIGNEATSSADGAKTVLSIKNGLSKDRIVNGSNASTIDSVNINSSSSGLTLILKGGRSDNNASVEITAATKDVTTKQNTNNAHVSANPTTSSNSQGQNITNTSEHEEYKYSNLSIIAEASSQMLNNSYTCNITSVIYQNIEINYICVYF